MFRKQSDHTRGTFQQVSAGRPGPLHLRACFHSEGGHRPGCLHSSLPWKTHYQVLAVHGHSVRCGGGTTVKTSSSFKVSSHGVVGGPQT